MPLNYTCQCAKKVVSNNLGLVDFRIGLVNSVHNLPNGQVKFFGGIQITEELRSIIYTNQNFFMPIKMTLGLPSEC